MSHLMLNLEPLESAEETVSLSLRDLTREQYAALCAANPDLRIERTACGEIIVMPPAQSRTGARNQIISVQLGNWALTDGRGMAFGPDSGFDLPNGANRAPDASWVLKSRFPAFPEEDDDFLPVCPDFVIELRSKSDRLSTLQEKMREYVENGARLGWLIDPKNRQVHVYRPGADVQILDNPDEVSADPELPGFVLKLDRVWKPW